MTVNFIKAISLFLLFEFNNIIAMEKDDTFINSNNKIEKKEDSLSQNQSVFCNFTSRLYYATSLTGYGTESLPLQSYLETYFKKETKFNFKSINLRSNKEMLIVQKRQSTMLNVLNLQATECTFTPNYEAPYFISQEDPLLTKIVLLPMKNIFYFRKGPSSVEGFQPNNYAFNCHSVFDISEDKACDMGKLLIQELRNSQKKETIKIYTTLRSVSTSLLMNSGHLCYAEITIPGIEENEGKMNVRIIDPTFNTNKIEFLKFNDLGKVSEEYFEKMAESLNLKLEHTYEYKGDQVTNFKDCGRFSTIYLHSALNDIDPMSLSPHDIYLGFQKLQKENFETFHQKNGLKRTYLAFFARYLIKAPCEFVLKYCS